MTRSWNGHCSSILSWEQISRLTTEERAGLKANYEQLSAAGLRGKLSPKQRKEWHMLRPVVARIIALEKQRATKA